MLRLKLVAVPFAGWKHWFIFSFELMGMGQVAMALAPLKRCEAISFRHRCGSDKHGGFLNRGTPIHFRLGFSPTIQLLG